MSVWKDKNTGRWRAKFRLDMEFHEKKGFKSREDARKWEVEERERLKKPETTTVSTSFVTLVDKYLEDCRARMGNNTWRAKACYYRNFSTWNGGDMKVTEITASPVNRFILHIAELQGNANANRHLKDLKAMFNWGMRQEDLGIALNPCRYVEPLPEDPFMKYVPPLADVKAALMAATPEQTEIIKCVYHSVARVGEVLKLKWEDVNFERRTVTLWTRKRKRGERRQMIKPMNGVLHELLKRKWDARDPEQPWVFLNPRTGRPYSERPRWMKDICERAGVKPFEFHSIRHAVAAALDDSGKVSLRDMRDFLGHERVSTTDLYLKSVGQGLRDAALVLEGIDSVASQAASQDHKVGNESCDGHKVEER